MTAWKPKFKAGDEVRMKGYGDAIWIVPESYVRGDGVLEVPSKEKMMTLLGVLIPQSNKMSREGFEFVAEAIKTPTTTATQPNYYRFEVRGVAVDIIDVIQGLGLGCEAGNVYKYLARAGKKDASKHIEDLEKAREWLDRLIEFRRRA